MEYIIYLIAFVLLLIIENVYFKIADKVNIIDKPNERSSHSDITIRGGGIIFPIGVFFWQLSAIISPTFMNGSLALYWFFGLGLLLISTISFVDDIYTLANRYRLPIHFVSVMLLFYQLGVLEMPIVIIVLSLIVVVGIINAVNFMDGINGITVVYGITTIASLSYINEYIEPFIERSLLIYALIGLIVFFIYNFRSKAKAFAGDVGSVSLAYILCFFIGKLIVTTNNPFWIFLLSVYGLDTIFTIVHRLMLKQNIFQAHRLHLYQLMVHKEGLSHLMVSTVYLFISCVMNVILIYNMNLFIICFSLLCVLYVFYRIKLYRK